MSGATDHSPRALVGQPSSIPPTPIPRMRGVILAGNMLLFGFLGILGIWSAFAPLESAAIAPGLVESESSRKVIQHLEGGIIKDILVKDGDTVKRGQILVRLDETRARAERQSWSEQYWDARVREMRLIAERDDQKDISIPPDVEAVQTDYPSIAKIFAGQQKIFQTRLQVFRSQAAIVGQRISQVEEEIIGLQAEEAAAAKRASIIREERTAVASLVDKGLERRPRLLSLDREMVEVDGRKGEVAAQISRARQVISEARATLIKFESDRQNEIAQSLREAQSQIAILFEKIRALDDQLSRTEVKAPEDGVITDLRIHTTGGVIGAGAPLMDLVPKDDRLIITARLRPEDIDVVRPALSAEIRLLPYNQRRMQPISGTVVYVSADRLTDKRTDQPYYAARIRIDDPQSVQASGVDMVSGMPVQAFIRTGQSTVALYALKPLLDSFNRAFRED